MALEGRTAWIAVAVPLGLLVLLLGLAANGWVKEREARVRAEQQTAEQQKAIAGLKEQQKQAQSDMDRQIAALEKRKREPVTARQFVTETATFLPSLPKPLEVREVAANPVLPDGPRVQEIVLPQEDLRVIRDARLTCEEDKVRLSACGSLQSNLAQQLKITETQRDEWRTTARGGSRWRRAASAAKWFAIGTGAGFAGYAIVHR